MLQEYTSQYTRGFITSRIGWSTDMDGTILCPGGLEKVQSGASGAMKDTKAKLTKHFAKGKENVDYDPNDPKNSQRLSMKLVSSFKK